VHRADAAQHGIQFFARQFARGKDLVDASFV
jgi:hypothetical protein